VPQRAAPASLAPDTGVPIADLAAQVRRIQIRARRLVASSLAGDYRSVFRGSGIEFSEAREYVPGDDVRLIDWNVTARTGTPWVKEYVEERELPVICAVDVSASMRAAHPALGRLGVAAELTALLTLTAAYHNDRSGLLLFGAGIERFVAPRRGTRHALRLVREVVGFAGTPRGSALAGACDYLARVLGRRSVVFVISDGFATGFEASLRALARRHEVLALTLVDRHDLALPDTGLVDLVDAESGTRVLIDSGDREARRRYAAAAQRRAAARREAFRSAGVDEIELDLDADYVQPLAAYFRQRASLRR
jgi:uncharacterized protein (DUF58 family)